MELTAALVLEGRLLTLTALTGLSEASLARPITSKSRAETKNVLSIAIGRTCFRFLAIHRVIRNIDF